MQVTTFIDSTKRFQFTIDLDLFMKHYKYNKEEKLKCLTTQSLWKLNNDYGLGKCLHNEKGPAILDLLTGSKDYALNGEYLKPSDPRLENIKNYAEFNDKFKDLLDD